jgi:hypothetical protein
MKHEDCCFGQTAITGILIVSPVMAEEHGSASEQVASEQIVNQEGDMHQEAEAGHHSSLPPIWLVAPFIILLLMIATGPLFTPFMGTSLPQSRHFAGSHRRCLLWIFNGSRYTQSTSYTGGVHILYRFATALFVASGGILIRFNSSGKPWINGLILFGGAILSNFIGTTGPPCC